ncbi:MAG: tRNA (adenosine(37)-N6)-threonylcarbamoyltransferase complex ATPase subunit type 1 TsaE [Deferribacteres bacterium]|nr:tRNA (adenosine(37)-N6)-threonylcarbamoyltransferase complex ATPase subunit type 1 TsaE [Deferribacteres bacterium]
MKFQSKSEAETRSIGRRLGKKLKRGDVVCLYGGLGSGKTTMAKGIASALGISERDVTSASF